jgi:hypothetical protein
MRNRRLAAALLVFVALVAGGCILIPLGKTGDFAVGFGCDFSFFPGGEARGLGSVDPCDCAIVCELGGTGGDLLGDCSMPVVDDPFCAVGTELAGGPLSAGPRGAGPSYELPPDAYFALGSHAAGAATSHQIGLTAPAGALETYSAAITYPGDFPFHGFGTGVVGELGIDVNVDGVVDAELPLIGTGGDFAFADFDANGAYHPLSEPTVAHSGNHLFTVTLPAGGDRNLQTLASTSPVGLVLTLFAGVLDNPATPGAYALHGDFTSVDPNTDDADDAAGDPPATLAVDETVDIGDGPCPPLPALGCNASFAKGKLTFKDGPGDKDTLRISVKKGVALDGFFGDPTAGTSHATCVYDGTSALIAELPIAAGGTGANGKPLWKLVKQKATYKDKTGAAGGVRKVGERSGSRAGFDVLGSGAALALPALPLQAPITVQHRTLDGGCGELVFDALDRNDATRVTAAVP